MITTSNANAILELYFAQRKAIQGTGKCYLGLSTQDPGADGADFEEPNPSTTGYKRVQININEATQYTNMMSEPVNGKIYNTKEITFPEATKEGYSVTHFGVFGEEAVGNGVPLYVHALTDKDGNNLSEALEVAAGEVLLFRQGTLSLEFVQD